MESAPFTTALTPIYSRSRAVRSSGRVANHYPRSSTPLRDLNTSSPTNRQEPVVQKKSSRTAVSAGKRVRKDKSHTDGVRVKVAKRVISTAPDSKSDGVTASTASGRKSHSDGVKEKIAKRAVSKAPASRGDGLTASTASGHSRFIESLAGELQKQKREELSKRNRRQLKRGYSRDTDQQVHILQKVVVKQSLYSRWKPLSSESIEMAMKALKAAISDVSSAESDVTSNELQQLRQEIRQELEKLKVPVSLVVYDRISAHTKAMERELDEANRDAERLSAEVQDADRCIKETIDKLKSFRQHDSVAELSSQEEE